jgi:lysyl-tRNA synthetase class 2
VNFHTVPAKESESTLQWNIGAAPEILKKRNEFNGLVRSFFARKNVLEVEIPLLGNYTATDAFTASIKSCFDDFCGYLQTSPESYLKQYLAHYPGNDVFHLNKVFRADFPATYHQPEFTLLEWYRHNFSWQQLGDEVIELIRFLSEYQESAPSIKIQKYSYHQCFLEVVGISPFEENVEWKKIYENNKTRLPPVQGVEENDNKLWQQLVWSYLIEPTFKNSEYPTITLVYDYPKELSIMAKLSVAEKEQGNSQQVVAKRFEIYYNGVELANGWEECNCSKMLRERMLNDAKERAQRGLDSVPLDEPLLNSIDKLKAMSGVALGIDRLYTELQGFDSIKKTLAFYTS